MQVLVVDVRGKEKAPLKLHKRAPHSGELVTRLDEVSALIREATHGNHDDVNDDPDTEATSGQQHQDASSYLANIKTVDAEYTQKDCQYERGNITFTTCLSRHVVSLVISSGSKEKRFTSIHHVTECL